MVALCKLAQHRDIWLDNPTQADDVAAYERKLLHRRRRVMAEHLGVERIELLVDMVDHRRAGVDQHFDRPVEQVARTAAHQLRPLRIFLLGVMNEMLQRTQLAVVGHDYEIAPGEEFDFADHRNPMQIAVERKMQHQEDIMLVASIVELWARTSSMCSG